MASFADKFKVRTHCRILSEEDKRKIHEAALDVMATTGIRIHSATARADLKKAGAEVDEIRAVVRLPRNVVESLMRTIPRTVILAGRDRQFDLPVDGTHGYITTDGCGISVWDSKTRTKRKSVLEDIRRTAVLSDWLPYISVYEPMVVAHDVPQKIHVVTGVKVSMENTSKHILSESTSTPEEARAQIRMASAVIGSEEELRKRHYLSAMVCTVSPLTLEGPTTEAGMVWAENHVPVHITGMAQAGMNAPATLAGDLVVNHAETLALACALQAHEPGAPLFYGAVLSAMDPRTGSYNGGSPESILLCCAAIEMATYCKIPNAAGGFGSSAKVPGVQASLENALSSIMAMLVGGEILNGVGVPDGSVLLSYEQILFDHEIAAMALRSLGGIRVDSDTLAVDLIKSIGIGGNYLGQKHTLAHVKEFHEQMLWRNETFESLVKKNGMDSLRDAADKVDSILKTHKPEPLSPSTSATLDKIVKEMSKS
jgi:trimethylamine--corrinoid protein Co-methyltransferase